MMYEMVLFDLDGTLLDTSPGIFGSVRYAEAQMGLKPINDSELGKFVGPPPKEMYKQIYGLSEDAALLATEAHRRYGIEKAVYEACIYEGIENTLKTLCMRGLRLGVATLKKQSIAEMVLKNFGLYHYFDVVVGMDDAESLTKELVIRKAKDMFGNLRTVMIGDSEYDYIGAKDAGVDFIGVLYGFGFEKEKEYLFTSVNKPEELLTKIL